MTKKLTWTTLALVAVFALVLSTAVYTHNAFACDKSAKTASAKASCDKSTAAKTASASSCCMSGAAATASASGCDKSAAKTASAGGCDKASAAKTASACAHGSVASSDCRLGKAAVAGYSKSADDACCKADKLAASLKEIVDEVPAMERGRVVVAGSMECGHCTYQATSGCQPLLKTADGKVYPLVHSNLVSSMHKDKGHSFEVTTNVKLLNGVKYLDVKAYKTM